MTELRTNSPLGGAAEDGALPAALCKVNKKNVPTRILLIQGGIVSLICIAFTLQPTVESAYFMISMLAIAPA